MSRKQLRLLRSLIRGRLHNLNLRGPNRQGLNLRRPNLQELNLQGISLQELSLQVLSPRRRIWARQEGRRQRRQHDRFDPRTRGTVGRDRAPVLAKRH